LLGLSSEPEVRQWPDNKTTTDGEYRFDFHKHTDDSIKDVWLDDPELIEWIITTWIEGRESPLAWNADLMIALRNVPEDFLEQQPAVKTSWNEATDAVLSRNTASIRRMDASGCTNEAVRGSFNHDSTKKTFQDAPPPIVEDFAPLLEFSNTRRYSRIILQRRSCVLESNTLMPTKTVRSGSMCCPANEISRSA
jgi:hypothetical protein